MTETYTKAELIQFLLMVQQKGMMNTNTAGGMRAAVGRILEDIPDVDDVQGIDIPTAVRRYANRHPGVLSPGSLSEYQRRVEMAVREFIKYKSDPAAYKPPARTSVERGATPKKPKNSAPDVVVPLQGLEATATAGVIKPVVGLSLEFPMRPDFLAQIVVPRDMKLDEARRFTSFILTLAQDFAPPSGS
ncbi:MAG: hypothetical protein ABI624_20045 [Casimicrobiaceae bacterium]